MESAKSGTGGLFRRLLASPRLAQMDRSRRLVLAEYRSITGSSNDDAVELFLEEVRELKTFFQRAFQVLTYNGIRGDYAEFGSCGARTFTLAGRAGRSFGHSAHLWAFDSFQGLPETEDPRDAHLGWLEGAMAMSEADFVSKCLADGLNAAHFTTVPGFYASSLAQGAEGPRPERIAFAYIDCDLYSSTIEALHFVESRLCHGAVIAFDDYYCCSETHPSGERLAAAEVFAEHSRWRLVPYIQFGWYGMSFLVEDRATGPARDIFEH